MYLISPSDLIFLICKIKEIFQNVEDPQDSFNFKCWFHQSYRGTKLEESTRVFLRNSPKSCNRFVFCFFNYDIGKCYCGPSLSFILKEKYFTKMLSCADEDEK